MESVLLFIKFTSRLHLMDVRLQSALYGNIHGIMVPSPPTPHARRSTAVCDDLPIMRTTTATPPGTDIAQLQVSHAFNFLGMEAITYHGSAEAIPQRTRISWTAARSAPTVSRQ
jgi:hypothetical protein